MSPVIHFEIDGEMVSSVDATWYLYAPCGCAAGVTVVDLPQSNFGIKATEDQAWGGFYERKELLDRDKKLGYTVVLGKRADVMEKLQSCPHTPQWGHEKTPVPEGNVWARSLKGRRIHLVPNEHKNDSRPYISTPRFTDEITAVCGSGEYSWETYNGIEHDYLECSKCAIAAKAAT